MKITVDSLERYGDWLNGIAKDASEQLKAAVFEYAAEMESQYGDISGWNREQIKELRDFTADMMIEVWHTHGDASASVGSMMFEETVGEDAPDLVTMSDQVSEDRARASAKYWAKHLFGDDASIGKFVEGCMSFVDRNVSHAADVQMIELSDELALSGKEIRYARVPRGPSCGFCIMLASRGFVYASKKTAGDLGGAFNDFHDRCDCRVIAGYDGLEVEGYDYQGMYERYRQCRKTIGDYDEVKKDWDSLTQEERDLYGRGERTPIPLSEDPEKDAKLRRELGKQANGFNDYLMKRIVQEMDTRDRQWMYDKTPLPEPGKEPDAKPKKKEKETAYRLQANGYKVRFRKPSGEGRTSDIYIISGNADSLSETKWEIKQPEGNTKARAIGKNTIDHQFEDAIGQSRNLVLDVTVVSSYPDVSFESMAQEAERLLRGKYRENYDEVMVVCGERILKIRNR